MVSKTNISTDRETHWRGAEIEPDMEMEAETVPPPIVERPDGFYWQASDGHQEFGPFESYESALADRDAGNDDAEAPCESLQEVEQEIGIADWIDAETGEPAEGETRPHLPED